jgi:hypothetical protein
VPVAVQLDFNGVTLEQYDRVVAVMGLTPGGPGGPGGLFHWVTATNEGIRVTDVWRDRESFERFADEKIGPSMQEAGVDVQPEISFFEVHNYLTAGD